MSYYNKNIDPKNIILMTDSYKVSHSKQYPEGTETVYSYFESRGGEFDDVVFVGLQYFLQEYLEGQVVTQERIDEAEEFFHLHFGNDTCFNREGWEHILNEHDGRLPVRIKAVREGTVVPTHNVMLTIENTDPKCWWLTNYLETLLVQVWYPCTVATISRASRLIIAAALEKSGTPAGIYFKLHDFGFRGVSSVETAGIGGFGHLVNFMGTDTVAALVLARNHYNTQMAGFSIPASEHSTITSWGKEGEVNAFRNMLEQYPTGLVACVSDSYDIYKACSELWGQELKAEILARDGTLVVRPDSGDPQSVVLECLERLGEAFGFTTNKKGYKVLDPHVRIIQGDGVDRFVISQILDAIMAAGWSADNIAFGSGGALLQKMNRDTQKFAFKCSWISVNGEGRDVFKDPIDAPGKRSKPGRHALVAMTGRDGNKIMTVPESSASDADLLETVFEDGEVTQDYTLDEVRKNTWG
jgi:nicotinamide phosphoribosyltransferase